MCAPNSRAHVAAAQRPCPPSPAARRCPASRPHYPRPPPTPPPPAASCCCRWPPPCPTRHRLRHRLQPPLATASSHLWPPLGSPIARRPPASRPSATAHRSLDNLATRCRHLSKAKTDEAQYGEQMVRLHGEEYDWRREPVDQMAVYSSGGTPCSMELLTRER
ncbi:hypothetical protein GUJ93_ZPchr0006g42588 [Zizania palustris]|uniref:Uncharacterized protein n=1 Tax=Zizania palustris TaxID=103762 RepID=A0A8J5SJD3_ZIZPA|nr:hypothetical protein GUJ93_ZPchr0006g42588 [Zizania palustris]